LLTLHDDLLSPPMSELLMLMPAFRRFTRRCQATPY